MHLSSLSLPYPACGTEPWDNLFSLKVMMKTLKKTKKHLCQCNKKRQSYFLKQLGKFYKQVIQFGVNNVFVLMCFE